MAVKYLNYFDKGTDIFIINLIILITKIKGNT